MKSMLVLATDYPDNDGKVSLMYIHTRNLAYIKYGYQVKVLNFSCKNKYIKDDIEVISLEDYQKNEEKFDILLSHASNIRNHYKFLKNYSDNFKKIIFFYHGHEVLKINKDYAKPYFYKKKNVFEYIFQNLYDFYKLKVWKNYLPKIVNKSEFIFVSNWMKSMFEKNVMNLGKYRSKVHITYNCIGKTFEDSLYDFESTKKYDFITIRSFLDGSKYAVDLVVELANLLPNKTFCVIGKGEFFNHFQRPENLIWINENLNHQKIKEYLNMSRIALMPTRTDAQGLMACEIASIGMPLLTSDIEICHEIFDSFDNVKFFSNNININEFVLKSKSFIKKYDKNYSYFEKNTIINEINVFEG